MLQEKQEQKNIPMNVEEASNSDLTYKNEAIEGTPFRYIESEGNGMLVFGTYAVESNLKNKDEAESYLEKESYNIITKMIIIMAELNNSQKTK